MGTGESKPEANRLETPAEIAVSPGVEVKHSVPDKPVSRTAESVVEWIAAKPTGCDDHCQCQPKVTAFSTNEI